MTDLVLADAYDLAAEFVRWEYAVALTGFLLGVNPFDEPNVTEAKEATAAILDRSLPAPVALVSTPECAELAVSQIVLPEDDPLALESALATVLDALEQGDYLALLAYVPERDALIGPALGRAGRRRAGRREPRPRSNSGRATCTRPASSTRAARPRASSSCSPGGPAPTWTSPGATSRLRELFSAQAAGDFTTLARHGRRALWVAMPDASEVRGGVRPGAGGRRPRTDRRLGPDAGVARRLRTRSRAGRRDRRGGGTDAGRNRHRGMP